MQLVFRFSCRKKEKSILLVAFILIGVVLGSCNSKAPRQDDFVIEDTIDFVNESPIKREENNYRIPTPIDLFLLLENSGALFMEESLNSPVKKVQYSTTSSRAINFGIYTTDLAYCSVFGNFQGSLIYFNTAKDIAVDLGMHEGYGEEMAYRINNNLNSIDSLVDISTDSYYQTAIFLENQGLSDILALIMVGCWIESIYMTIESVDTFDINDPIIERVADQRLLLDNLIELLKLSDESIAVQNVLNKLEDMQEVFDELYYNADETLITKQQYVGIANKIRELREGFVG